MTSPQNKLNKTPLYDWHLNNGAKMIPFAGYSMPIQYKEGIISEHKHTRNKVSIFDVSHMGQAIIRGNSVSEEFEKIVPANISGLGNNQLRYTQFTNESGGIIDDLIVTKQEDKLFVVVNASEKETDYAHIHETIGNKVDVHPVEDRALLALQGPEASITLSHQASELETLAFMAYQPIDIKGIICDVSRCGYTGEDGFEISVAAKDSVDLIEILMENPEVKPAGLGARDTLRLEAGLCLYGSDINHQTSPIEAGLTWSIDKRRKIEGGFIGDSIILSQIQNGPTKKRVGIILDGKIPARANTNIFDSGGKKIGLVTSGGYSPTLACCIAMGYVNSAFDQVSLKVKLDVRGNTINGMIIKLPFIKHKYYKEKIRKKNGIT